VLGWRGVERERKREKERGCEAEESSLASQAFPSTKKCAKKKKKRGKKEI
jgi:hypothetical protein